MQMLSFQSFTFTRIKRSFEEPQKMVDKHCEYMQQKAEVTKTACRACLLQSVYMRFLLNSVKFQSRIANWCYLGLSTGASLNEEG